MTVAVFIANESDANSLIQWGIRFAQADRADLLVVCPKKSKGKIAWESIKAGDDLASPLQKAIQAALEKRDPAVAVLQSAVNGGESIDGRVIVRTQVLLAPKPETAFIESVGELNLSLLLLTAQVPAKGTAPDDAAGGTHLFAEAPCQTMMIRGPAPKNGQALRILLASHDDTTVDDRLAIQRAGQLVGVNGTGPNGESGELTMLYVCPDDDVVAADVARRHLSELRKNIVGKDLVVQEDVALADKFSEGIGGHSPDNFDLLLVGTRNPRTLRTLFRDVWNNDVRGATSIAAVRQAVPFANRQWDRFKNFVRSKIPQMDRELRISLVDRLQNSSKFDFDFVALISLSTLIAALGLARDSGAVVIGAMLVAPLMTPLVAMGFALVQGNERLIRSALRSVYLGFAVALAIGAVVGLLLSLFSPHLPISQEMRDRCYPNLLDLVVALASGVAGAYAIGRPNLNSAIPGVAIAAALVPPIATSGQALTRGSFWLAGGASLLFFTNIVAIVLGTAITFWAVGISTRVDPTAERPPLVWPRYWFYGFVIISFLLAAGMSIVNPVDAPMGVDAPTGVTNLPN